MKFIKLTKKARCLFAMKKIILLFILIIGGAGFFYWKAHKPEMKDEIKLFGNVEIRQVSLGFRVPGRLEKIFFEEGETVKNDELLGYIDPVPYEIQKTEAGAALIQAQANLEKMQKGHRPEEIHQAEANREQTLASLKLAEIEFERISRLYSEKVVPKNELDKTTAARDSLRAQLNFVSASLALMREGFRTEDIRQAEAAREVAEARLKYAENSLSDTKLYSPSNGTILTRISEPGTVLATGQPIYALALARPLQVRAYLSEPQLGLVKLGMKGKIYTDSFQAPLEGTVNFIASEAEFTPKQVQTEDLRTSLVYRVRLLVGDNPNQLLKNGMPVTVIIEK